MLHTNWNPAGNTDVDMWRHRIVAIPTRTRGPARPVADSRLGGVWDRDVVLPGPHSTPRVTMVELGAPGYDIASGWGSLVSMASAAAISARSALT
jgi:hypothetical protein